MSAENVLLDYQAAVVSPKQLSPMREFVEHLQGVFEADSCVLSVLDIERQQISLLGAAGIESNWVQAYEAELGKKDPWWGPLTRIARGEEQDRSIMDEGLDQEKLQETEYYQSWMKPQRLLFAIRGGVAAGSGRVLMLSCYRSEKRGPFKRAMAVGLRYILPSLRQILLMTREARQLTLERDAAVDTIDRLTLGVILVDGHGKPVAVNRSATEIIQQSRALTIDRAGVFAVKPHENARLQNVIERMTGASDDPNVVSEMVPVSRPAGATPIAVVVSRLKTAKTAEARKDPVAALFVSDPDSPIQNTEERLRSLYSLTRLEARLAIRIAQGLNLDDIAAELRISIHTARAYLKQVFAKTNVHRQSALVRILVNGASQIRTVVICVGISAALVPGIFG